MLIVIMSFGPGSGSPYLPWGETTAAAVDPQWSQQKVDAWKRWATENTDVFDYSNGGTVQADFDGNDSQGVDMGIRPLLYDLNKAGYQTYGSNLASSGSSGLWKPYVNIMGQAPRGVYNALDRYAPRGYSSYTGGESYNQAGRYDIAYTHESCSDPADIRTCSHQPTAAERAKVDSAFIRAIRSVL